jgi:hypothetical protein
LYAFLLAFKAKMNSLASQRLATRARELVEKVYLQQKKTKEVKEKKWKGKDFITKGSWQEGTSSIW